jgi:cell division protein FtsA
MVSADERIEVAGVSGKPDRSVLRRAVCEIIEPRLDEVLQLIRREIAKSGYEDELALGAVMTGGSMLLPGAIEMAEEVLAMPVRLGVPMHVQGLVDVISSPIYATGVGLVLYGMKRQERGYVRLRDKTVLGKVRHRVSDWLSDFF